ncbi:hypothetical protein ACLB2K_068696 [Fragaria x ananassa]
MAYPPLGVGFRFRPTDRELVAYYLHNRAVMGDQFQSSFVFNCPDIYGQTESWIIWDLFGGNLIEEGEALYFFTQRKKLNPKAKRFHRKVGSGTWSAQSKDDVVSADHHVIGTKREFRYEKGSDPLQNGIWLMQEYELTSLNDMVLCTLRKSPRPPAETASSSTAAPPLNQSVDENFGNKMKRKMNFCEEEEEEDSCKRKKLEPPKPSYLYEQHFDVDKLFDFDHQPKTPDHMVSVAQPFVQVEKSNDDLIMPSLISDDESLEAVQVMASVGQSICAATINSLMDSPISFEHFDAEVDEFLGLTADDYNNNNNNEDGISQFSSSDLSCLD